MSSYLLDTSVIIDYLRGKPKAVTLLNSLDGELCSSYICLSELYEGVYRVTNPEKTAKIVTDFFASLTFVFGVDAQIAEKFGEIRAQLKKRGNVIEDLDIFLAATCLANDLTLITFNQKHFSNITSLQLYPTS
jgi:tRNA(fMet)-specific endonuclease VapC